MMMEYRKLVRNLRVRHNEKLAFRKHANRLALREEREKNRVSQVSDNTSGNK